MLPVLLALLFVGGSEQPLFGTSAGQSPGSSRTIVSKLTSYGKARTALCLLPALLGRARTGEPVHLSGLVIRCASFTFTLDCVTRAVAIDGQDLPSVVLARSLDQRPPPAA
jgi:hypothetical protein